MKVEELGDRAQAHIPVGLVHAYLEERHCQLAKLRACVVVEEGGETGFQLRLGWTVRLVWLMLAGSAEIG